MIEASNKTLLARYSKRVIVHSDLKRTLVSFQANKSEQGYRWF